MEIGLIQSAYLCQNELPMAIPQKKSSCDSAQYCVIDAPFGRLGILTELVDGSLMLSKIEYLATSVALVAPQNLLAKEVAKQCRAYFKDPHYQFNLPLKPTGTLHQQKVWHQIQRIPAGSVTTYGDLAKKIKSGPRAVGTACGANPYPLISPCHRVVAAQGIGGFMKQNSPGLHRQIKIWLLEHEGAL